MTCDHCVHAVRAEVAAVAGVTGVEVGLATGSLTVVSEHPLEETAVPATVEEAGYEVSQR